METKTAIHSPVTKVHSDAGWTLVEALISVVLISIIFLGFTVSVLAFKEWTTRSWAIRVMDQYANDVVSSINEKLNIAYGAHVLSLQNGLGRFQLDLLEIDLYNTQNIDSNLVTFSAHPREGVKIAQMNVAAKNIDPSTPFDEWWGKHNFTIQQFEIIPGTQLYSIGSLNFQESIVQINLRFQYERIHMVDTGEGSEKESYFLNKEYRISAFLKNHLHQPTSG
ncbi:hypothetical protein KJ564_12410 [bacterium]|nr:hypothetical protein [bacterium]